eukprot:1208898-Pleurochrysis_carterae.AAC.1
MRRASCVVRRACACACACLLQPDRVIQRELGATRCSIFETHADGRQHIITQFVTQPQHVCRQVGGHRRLGRAPGRALRLALRFLATDGDLAHVVPERAERRDELQRRGRASALL